MAGITASELNIILTARDREFTRSMDRAIKRVKRFEGNTTRSLSKASRSFSKLGRTARIAGSSLSAAIPAAAPIAAAAGATALLASALASAVSNGDKLRLLSGRIEAITGSAAQAKSGVEGLTDIMFETGASLEGAASAFTRFTQAGKAIGATQKQTLQLTDTMLKLGRIGGGTEQELTSGAIQLAQALASGQLRGDELRSVMENLPLVSEALASSLGVGIGKLREMAEAGELTSRKVFDALLSKSDETNRRFSQMPLTVEVASGRMAAAWTRFTAGIDESLGLSQKLAGVLDGIADRMDRASSQGIKAIDFQIEDAEKQLAALQNARTGRNSLTLTRRGDTAADDETNARIVALKAERAALVKFLSDKEAAESRASAATSLAASKTGAALFSVSQARERELALLSAQERAILKAQDAAEAGLRETAPLVSEEDVENVRAFAAETVKMQEARKASGKAAVDHEAELYALMDDQLDALRIRDALLGQSEGKQAEILTRERLIAEARRRNIPINATINAQIEDQAQTVGELTGLINQAEEAERARADGVRKTLEEQERLKESSLQANQAMAEGLTNAFLQANSLEDALKRVAIQLVEIAASSFLTGAINGKSGGGSFLSNIFSGLGASAFSGGGGGSGSAFATGSLSVTPGATGFATGGQVFGKGGPTSDSIPAMLSNGEHVINAAAARRNRPTLEAINSGRTPSGSGSQSVHVTVDAGPEFDVRVEQSAASVAQSAVSASNSARDRSFTPRMMAAQSEMEKDYR